MSLQLLIIIRFYQGRVIIFDPEFLVRGEKSWPTIWFRPKAISSDNIMDITLDYLKNERDPNKPFFPNAPL